MIDSACVGNRVWYAAVEILENDVAISVTAVICDVRWTPNAKDGYVFAYKDMGENAGPCSDDCPERILRLLLPDEQRVRVELANALFRAPSPKVTTR